MKVTSSPRVGAPARGSKSGRPIMVVFDLLGRRGAMRILWELRGEPLNFRQLIEAAQTNPALLNTRLAELRAVDLVAHEEGGYRLTGDGAALLVAMQPIGAWAERWGRRARPAA
jgi:DNA-binding HxlR family transcriptional regulator